MLRNKKEVDRHVRDLLSKVRTDEERKIRGYNIARSYHNIGEHTIAARYLAEFLMVRPRAVDAHRLLGQINEGLGNKEKAVQAYKMAYGLVEGQKDLALKICELYTEVEAEPSVKLHWAEEGQRLYPHHDSVVKLREALLSKDGTQSREELENLYLEEIKARPLEVRLYTNLLRLYLEWGADDKTKLTDAYHYGCQVELRKAFTDSLVWYQTLLDVMQAYRDMKDVKQDKEFHTNYLSVLERLIYLTLASCSGSALLSQYTLQDAAKLLLKFDQSLKSHLHVVGQETMFGQLMVGQLYLHMAIFLIHNAKKEGLIQANTKSGALLFHACRFRPPEKTKSWKAREHFWHKLACHRLSQAAHILRHMAGPDTERTKFLDRVKRQCSNKEAQLNIHQSLFGASKDTNKDSDSSYFLSDEEFITASLQYPGSQQVKEWDHVVGGMCCASLGDLVWLCLQQAPDDLREPQPYYSFALFDGLQFSSIRVDGWNPETLCHLDLLAYLAATVYCQRVAARENHGPPPATLPTILSPALCTSEQGECWKAAHTLFTNRAHHNLGKLRMTLQRGLEVIRAHGNHGINLPLMAHLAQCFTKWASVAEAERNPTSEVEALRERAEHYWQRVLSLCQHAARNITNVAPRYHIFVAPGMDLTEEERSKVEEEGKFFLAMRLVQAGKQHEAIQALGDLKSPEAAYQRAMLYKEQAQAMVGEGGVEAATAEARTHQASLLTQTRDTLYLTLDRLRMPDVDRFHPLNTKLSQQLEDVERLLSLLNAAGHTTQLHHQDNDSESLSDSSHSPHDLTNGHDPSSSLHHTPHPTMSFSRSFNASISSSPQKASSRVMRQEARPSRERLHAQVQALSEVQETTLRNMEEQNTALKAHNEALRDLCTSMTEGFRENSSLYRSMLEQTRAISQDAYNSVLGEVQQMHATIRTLAADISELKAMRTAAPPPAKLPEPSEVKPSDEVPVDIPAAVVPPGLYGGYVGYYSQPSPLMPTPGLFGNPPFFPPSTIPDQTYSMASTANQGASITSMAQTTTTSLVNPTPCSPATITVPSPAASTLGLSHTTATGNWGMATTMANTTTSRMQPCADAPTPPHAFQITMPPTSSTLTPPPRSMPGELVSHTLPCSTTAGLLANVPPPLYSAVTPDSSPVRGESHVRSLSSSKLSTEGLATPPAPPNSLVASSTTTAGPHDASSITAFPGGFRSPAVAVQDTKVSPVKGNRESEDDECYVEDDHDPCPDYKPLVPLPEKVEVRTGEEDEQVLFEERAKLFRFVEKEWKERGTGIMKLLHNPGQESVRVLMRRDQTYKICANHLISSNTELQAMKSNDKAWIWAAQDYADEELRTEKFCCRFKTTELASNFRDAFMKAKAIAQAKEETGGQEQMQQVPASTITAPSLAMLFKSKPGSWRCDTCLVANKEEAGVCVACSSPNPNASTPTKADSSTTATTSSPFASFKFSPSSIVVNEGTASTATSTPSTGFKFMGTPSTPASATITVAAAASTTPATSNTFGFKFTLSDSTTTTPSMSTATPPPSTPATTTTTAAAATPDTTKDSSASKFSLRGFTFSTSPSLKPEKKPEEPQEEKKECVFAGFSFGSNANTSVPSTGFTFASPAGSAAGNSATFGEMPAAFNLSSSTTTTTTSASSLFTTKTPSTGAATHSPQKDDGDDRVEEYEPQVDFQPVVPMPDLVEVKTGEEGEEVLFCERSKLFRFDKDSKEWKERGIGDLKILKNNSTGKVRVLMRREVVLKVCANHFITPDIKLAPMGGDKAWIWMAHDFADEEMRKERFAARFKTQELASSFKEAFEKGQRMVESATSRQSPAKPSESASEETTTITTTTTTPSLASLFPQAAGSWECEVCLVRNKASETTCVSCTTPRKTQQEPEKASPSPQTPKTSSLAAMFQPPAGSWVCDACLVRNKEESRECVACGSSAPGTQGLECQPIDYSKGSQSSAPASNTPTSSAMPSSSFKFGVDSKQTFTFGIPQSQQPASTTPQPSFTFGLNTPKDSTSKPATFSFGINTTPTTSGTLTPKTDQPASSFTSNKPFAFTWQPPTSSGLSVSFAPTQPVAIPSSQPAEATTPPSATPTKDNNDGFVFGSPGKYEFSFAGVKAKSPRSRDISLCESEEGLVEEDEGDHLYFEPVVPLPDKVEVVTGEEDEDVLYSHRAKLFRLVQGEWKERGIGDIKILLHNETSKIRLVMRREQVHKLCLNHYLEKDLEMRRKDDKAFYWVAMDHSEAGAPKTETFAIRFKTQEIAVEFFEAVNEAKVQQGGTAIELPKIESSSPSKTENTSTPTPTKPVVAQADSTTPVTQLTKPCGSIYTGKTLFRDEVEVVYEKKATPEQVDRARKLQLPDNFFLYEDAPPCPGCCGCEKEGSGEDEVVKITASLPVFGGSSVKPLQFGNTPIPSSTSSMFGKQAGSPSLFSGGCGTFTISTTATTVFGSNPPVFSKPVIFGTTTTTSTTISTPSIFGGSPATTSATSLVFGGATTTTSSVFGGAASTPSTTPSIFGGATTTTPLIFGGSSTPASTTPSMFGGSASTSQSIFGGATTITPVFGGTATTTPSVLGGTATTTPSVFGGATTTTLSMFGGTTTAASSTPSIFGGNASSTSSVFGGATSTTPLIFGGSTTTTTTASSTPSMFSTTTTTTTTASSTPSMFGSTTTTTASSTSSTGLFGSSTPTSSLFSASVSSTKLFDTTTKTTTPGFFTASLANATAAAAAAAAAAATATATTTTPTMPSMFGTPMGSAVPGPFGTEGTSGGVVQSSQSITTTPSQGKGGPLSSPPNDGSQISFADLAVTSNPEGFVKKSMDPKVAAVWAKRNQPVFGGKGSPKKGGEGEEDVEEEDVHDPHFEPVVPLPDLVEVKTGEEDLEIMFSHRAKLYRYDGPTKQWKERGVGDFKILHDPVTSKYRLLQRREQVHKLCCNHYLTAQLELHPLHSSETAWCWYAIDFSEKAEGVNEQLAIKFKTVELAKQFKDKFEECQEQLKVTQASGGGGDSSTSTSAVVVLPLTTTTQQHQDNEEEEEDDEEVEEEEEDDEVDTEDEEDEEDNEDEEEEDDDDDGNSVMFTERCSLSRKEKNHWNLLGAGQLTMQYDDDVFGARITVTSDCGNTMAEHIIAIQTTMHHEGHSATWSVLNLAPQPQGPATFKATFFSQEALNTFTKAFLEAKEYAENSNLAEEPSMGLEEVAAADLYYGQGADKD